MKISALRKMIHEEVRKAVRSELKALLKDAPAQPVPETSLSEIRSQFKRSQSGTESNGLEPENAKAIVNGEVYASGKGVMDWFKQSQTESVLQEHEQKLAKMEAIDDYVETVLPHGGKRRV